MKWKDRSVKSPKNPITEIVVIGFFGFRALLKLVYLPIYSFLFEKINDFNRQVVLNIFM